MAKLQNHVFISYVRENQNEINRLYNDLTNNGVKVWIDRNDIKPGSRWKDAIREAINDGAFFIACFSHEYHHKTETHMNEELTQAIDRLRKFNTKRNWFIPLLLSKCDIPDRSIGGGETLSDLQWVSLYEDWENGIKKILNVINSIRISKRNYIEDETTSDPSKSIRNIVNNGLINFYNHRIILDKSFFDVLASYEGQIQWNKEECMLIGYSSVKNEVMTEYGLSLLKNNLDTSTLCNCLETKNEALKISIIKILGEIGDDKVCNKLINILKENESHNIILETIDSLGKLGCNFSIIELKKLLNHDNVSIVDAAISSLVKLNVTNDEWIKIIEKLGKKETIHTIETYLKNVNYNILDKKQELINILNGLTTGEYCAYEVYFETDLKIDEILLKLGETKPLLRIYNQIKTQLNMIPSGRITFPDDIDYKSDHRGEMKRLHELKALFYRYLKEKVHNLTTEFLYKISNLNDHSGFNIYVPAGGDKCQHGEFRDSSEGISFSLIRQEAKQEIFKREEKLEK